MEREVVNLNDDLKFEMKELVEVVCHLEMHVYQRLQLDWQKSMVSNENQIYALRLEVEHERMEEKNNHFHLHHLKLVVHPMKANLKSRKIEMR